MRYAALFLFLFFPLTSHAYLDPSSGNAIICLILSLGGAIVFFIKNAFYKIKSFVFKSNEDSFVAKDKNKSIVIFSEGKSYWLTFKGIVENLIKREVDFHYYTMDLNDPGLEIDNKYMHSKYIGDGSLAYLKISRLKASIMLVTTPNIGCLGYPIARSCNLKKLAHIVHAVGDQTYYKKGSLNNYDISFEIGNWVEKRTRIIEEKYSLKPKEIVVSGLPYLDELSKKITPKSSSTTKCILIAPSWGDKCCLNIYGISFIKELLDNGFNVILRPHPQSFKFDYKLYETILSKYSSHPLFQYDTSLDSSDVMSKADLMISDNSSVRFDFSFLYEKPVISLKVPQQNLTSYEADTIGSLWDEECEKLLGVVIKVDEENFNECNISKEIFQAVKELQYSFDTNQTRQLYTDLVANHGSSAEIIANYLISNSK